MKSILIIAIGLCFSLNAFCQNDSIEVFFIGNVKGESYRVFFGEKRFSFKGSNSYKYSIRVPVESGWSTGGWINNVTIYRKGKFAMFYKEVPLTINYESNMRYLVIWRNRSLRNRISLEAEWSNTEPKKMPNMN